MKELETLWRSAQWGWRVGTGAEGKMSGEEENGWGPCCWGLLIFGFLVWLWTEVLVPFYAEVLVPLGRRFIAERWYIYIAVFVFVWVCFHIRSKKRNSAKEWILSLEPLLRGSGVKISGKLISKIVPLHGEYEKIKEECRRIKTEIGEIDRNINVHQQNIQRHNRTITTIESISGPNAPQIKKERKKIEKERQIIHSLKERHSRLLKVKQEQSVSLAALKEEAREVIAKCIGGEKPKGDWEGKMRKEWEYRERIKALIKETEGIIEKGRARTKDSMKLAGFLTLQNNLDGLLQSVESEEIPWEKVEEEILILKEEAEILSTLPEKETGEEPNYYQILGVKPDAPLEEIKRRYRLLATVYHPDKGAKDDEMFKRITEAYEVLSDESK